jgi:hypothetical protein
MFYVTFTVSELCDNGILKVLSVSYILLWELLTVARNYGTAVCALHAQME